MVVMLELVRNYNCGNILNVKPTVHTEMRSLKKREKLKVTLKCLAEATGRRVQHL